MQGVGKSCASRGLEQKRRHDQGQREVHNRTWRVAHLESDGKRRRDVQMQGGRDQNRRISQQKHQSRGKGRGIFSSSPETEFWAPTSNFERRASLRNSSQHPNWRTCLFYNVKCNLKNSLQKGWGRNDGYVDYKFGYKRVIRAEGLFRSDFRRKDIARAECLLGL